MGHKPTDLTNTDIAPPTPLGKRGRPQRYPEVRRQMIDLIESPELKPGAALESEKRLCERLKVSRPLIRRALRELSQSGRIISIPGKGHFLAEADERSRPTERGTIVCALGSASRETAWHGDHLDGMMKGIEQAIHPSAHRLLWERLGTHHDIPEMVKPHFSGLLGMIVVPLADQPVAEYMDAVPQGVAKVIAGRPAGELDVPCVYVNHRKGMAQATNYLLGQGHRKIGYVSHLNDSWPVVERLEGYREALAAGGQVSSVCDRVIAVGMQGEHVEHGVTESLKRSPGLSALIVASGMYLPWVLRALHRRSIRVPEDLSVVCFDDEPIARQYLPAITVVRQPSQQLGFVAGQMLLEALSSPSHGSHVSREVTLECELVVRDSVTPLHSRP